MPTRRKSLSQLALSGTLAKNIGRYQARLAALPVVIHPVGLAPRRLNQPERLVWAEVVKNAPRNLLTTSDRLALEVLVGLVVRVRTTDAKVSEVNALLNLLSKFGMVPADRLRMNIERFPEPEEVSAKTAEDLAWDELDN